MKRSQKRIWTRNQDLSINEIRPVYTHEIYDLYEKYISLRHADGDMYPPKPEQFSSFLVEGRPETVFYEFRRQNRLVAVAVVDRLQDGLSAIYTFFDPEEQKTSPGVYTILWEIETASRLNLPFVYLGYWIKQSSKMNYKTEYKPIEMFVKDHWVLLR
jgi:arginine-tRNA-protein transferase